MKALSIGLSGATLLVLAAGCRPQLAEVELGDAEMQWNSFVRDSYPGFRPPRTAAPAIKDKYTALPAETAKPADSAEESDTADDDSEIIIEETVVEVKPEAAADDPTVIVKEESIVIEVPAEDGTAKKPDDVKFDGKFIEYVVKPGDTLSGIARKFYQDGHLFERIYEANKAVIPNPNMLPLGAKIKIPQL
ncbi:MAG: LysM peptidoglycan-binding domain-containing protein [Victivallales bacterium]|jgi:nucleoid-associated protein YgaU|nr:LysM peptidoglycan-binding domain-containing protein [Victivallales bacterium]